MWYPSGGFGHYINAILSLYGRNFARPQKSPEFSKNGNSHSLDLVMPAYVHEPNTYDFNFDLDLALKYSVIIDNGINNEDTKFRQFFPDAKIIKLCYSDFSWPVVAHTMIVKAMNRTINLELPIDSQSWNCDESWVRREKYFLFLRDHKLRHSWKPDLISTSVMIEELLDYEMLRKRIGIDLDDFESFWKQWYQFNKQYFQPVLTAKKILQGDFESTDDVWTQAVVYYQIWCKYGVEVPHNDYSNWFESYDNIVKMLNTHGVTVDQS